MAKNLGLFKELQNPNLYFYNKDIPLFSISCRFLNYAPLNFFFWKRTVIGHPEMARQQFNGVEASEGILETAKKIIELYTQIPSTEIWNEESVHCTIKQIEFYRQSNIFADKQILLKVYSQLEELLHHIEMQAEVGKKFYIITQFCQMPFRMIYINEFLLGDNFILVESLGNK